MKLCKETQGFEIMFGAIANVQIRLIQNFVILQLCEK